MSFDRRGLVLALGIAAWAAFFDWLWLTGHAGSYVGSRTRWVVPFGGVVLTLTAGALLVGALRRRATRPLRAREFAGLIALLAPVIAVIVVPMPSLGAFAVDRKASDRALVAFNSTPAPASQPLRLLDLAVGTASPDYARRRGVTNGRPVSVTGFVSATADGIRLQVSRFYTYCCAADAIPYSVAVQAPQGGGHAIDDWVRVTGTVVRAADGSYAIRATSVAKVPEPRDPYATA